MKITKEVRDEIIAKEQLGLTANKVEDMRKACTTILDVVDAFNSLVGADYVKLTTEVTPGVFVKSNVRAEKYLCDARFGVLVVPSSVKYEQKDCYAELKRVDGSVEGEGVELSVTPEEFESAQQNFFKLKGLERGPLVSMDTLIKAVALSQVASDVCCESGYRWDENSKRYPVMVKEGVFDADFNYWNVSAARWKTKYVTMAVEKLDAKATATSTGPKTFEQKTKSNK